MPDTNTNPAGNPIVRRGPRQPPADVVGKQDPAHTEADFFRDLEKASTNRSKEQLAKADAPSRPDPRRSGT